MQLMREMVSAGEVAALVPERVWQETESALASPRPDVFISVLRECGALGVIFPEVDALWGVPQPEQWHPEIDTGAHLLMALEQSGRLSSKPEVAFAVLVHDLGKAATPRALWPKHTAHEERSVELAQALCRRMGVPGRFAELGCAVARYHGVCHRALELRPATVLSLLEGVDAFRRADRFEDFLTACEADARGRLGRSDTPYPQASFLRDALRTATTVSARELAAQGLAGEDLGAALRQKRIEALAGVKAKFTPAD
jgi:tRNA nucleotidyltransferase (CCA-adding enzyme)